MVFTRIHLRDWRNFTDLDVPLADRIFAVGPNATGKSNFLDAFSFLRDIATSGLRQALDCRGGLPAVMTFPTAAADSLSQPQSLALRVEARIAGEEWSYELELGDMRQVPAAPNNNWEPLLAHREFVILSERVTRSQQVIVDRPTPDDEEDPILLTQTHLEQLCANRPFKTLWAALSGIHLIDPSPELLREISDPTARASTLPAAGAHQSRMPGASDWLTRMAAMSRQERTAILSQIRPALTAVVPQLERLEIAELGSGSIQLLGGPFSDGSVRLFALLWELATLPLHTTLVLMDEPEVSLDTEVIRSMPTFLERVLGRRRIQLFVSTHSDVLIDDPTVSADEVLVLLARGNISSGQLLSAIGQVEDMVAADLPFSDALRILAARRLPSHAW